MMTIGTLFTKRVKNEWHFQIKVWRSVIDWTVALYIVIPLLIMASVFYISWWNNPPEWMFMIQLPFVILILYLFAFSGTIRLFVEEADQLILLQRNDWITGLKKRGVIYSLSIFAISSLFIHLLLLPFLWNVYQWDLIQLVSFFLFHYLFKVHIALLRQHIESRFRRLKRFYLLLLLFVICAVLFIYGTLNLIEQPIILLFICILLTFTFFRLVRQRIHDKHSFMIDVQREQKEKLRFVTMLLGQAQVIEKKSWFMPEGPLLFPKSTTFFKQRTPKNILAEMYIKAFFRKGSLIRIYLQMTGISIIAMISTPIWIKLIVSIGIAWILATWLNSFCHEVQSSAYVKMFKWKLDTKYPAIHKAVTLMMIPWILVMLIVLTILLLI